MRRRLFNILAAAVLLPAFQSCIHDGLVEAEDGVSVGSGYRMVEVVLDDPMSDDTKSVFGGDDSAVKSLSLFAFDENSHIMVYDESAGSKAGQKIELFAEEGESIRWLLPETGPYSVYAVANMGDITGKYETLGMLVYDKNLECNTESISDFDDTGIPMRGIVRGFPGGESLSIPLTRIMARYDLRLTGFEDATGNTYKMVSCKTYNANGSVHVFGENEHAEAEEVVDLYDMATPSDIEALNAGQTVSFYLPENMQTTANGYTAGEAEHWKQAGENLSSEARSVVTNFRFEGIKTNSNGVETPFTWHFYIGPYGLAPFDIKRNTVTTVSLDMAGNNDEFEVTTDWSNNFHSDRKFYITENVKVDFAMNSYTEELFDGSFRLRAVDENGREVITFAVPVSSGNGNYYAMGTCVGQATAAFLEIVDENDVVYVIDRDIVVEIPNVAVNAFGDRFEMDPVTWDEETANVCVNSYGQAIYAYLTDEDGINLNQGHYYGIDVDLCRWSIEIIDDDLDMTYSSGDSFYGSRIVFDETSGASGDDGYAAKLDVDVLNDGEDTGWNRTLTGLLGRKTLRIREDFSRAYRDIPFVIDANVITVTMVPSTSDQKSVLGTELAYKVSNASNIPIFIEGLRLNDAEVYLSTNVPDVTAAEASYEWFSLITGSYDSWTASNPLYVSEMERTELSQSSDIPYVEDGDYVYYPAYDSGVTEAGAEMVIAADYRITPGIYQRSQYSLYHVMNAGTLYQSDNSPEIQLDLAFNDTMTNSIIWGSEGYRSMGMTYPGSEEWVDIEESNGGSDFGKYGSFITGAGKLMDNVVYVDMYFDDQQRLMATASEDITLSISVEGILYSRVRGFDVDDFGITKCLYEENECPFLNEHQSYLLSSAAVPVDGDVIGSAFDYIRTLTFYSTYDVGNNDYDWHTCPFCGSKNTDCTCGIYKDSDNFGNGSSIFREYLKPYYIDLMMDVKPISGKTIAVRFDNKLEYIYDNGQADPTWVYVGIQNYYTGDPATYPGHSCEDCADGSLFHEGEVTLKFSPVINQNHDITLIRAR